MTPEEHMDSLEARWASGQYLNPKQMFEAMGGKILAPGADLNHPWANAQLPGIGPFPGMVDKVR
jgi:hypothetical protein